MLDRNAYFSKMVSVYASTKEIRFGNSFAKVISADAASKHGYAAHLVVIDELHTQPNSDLVDVLVSSTSARAQPLTVYISTADYDRPSICNDVLSTAKAVRDGTQVEPDARFLPMIFEAGKNDDWHDREVWRRVNPSLGTIKSMAYLEHEHAKACERPSYAATFRRLELNQQTQTKSQWLSLEDWDAMATTKPDFSLLVQTKWFAGLDLATRLDVAAFVLVGDVPTVGLFVLPFFWIPEANAKAREERDRVPYSQWADSGLIKMTEGNVIDLETVANDVVGLAKQFNVSEVAFDPWNATETTRRLAIAGIPLVEFSQGYKTM
jgi:phage terminase large subunit-like protein